MASSMHLIVLNTKMMRGYFNTNETDKPGEEVLKISCKYKRGDKVRYEWKNGEIRSGIVIYIQCSVGIKDSVTGSERSVPLEDIIGYDK